MREAESGQADMSGSGVAADDGPYPSRRTGGACGVGHSRACVPLSRLRWMR
jgi:hypothetical protein